MDKKVKNLVEKINTINSMIIDNLDATNVDSISVAINNFERKIRTIINPPTTKVKRKEEQPVWTKFPEMTEEEIREEFMNIKKYPTLESIKEAVRGYLDLQKVTKVKTRETLIKHIIETYGRGRFISKIGR